MEESLKSHSFSIAVCDDQLTDREMITHMTREMLSQEGVPCEIACFESGMALLEAIRAGVDFQILLLDVMMGEMDGMALAATLRELGHQTAIIFISAYQEWALQGYEVSAARFIAKPINADKLREALIYCVRELEKDKTIILSTAAGKHRLTVSDIVFAETWGRGIRVHYADCALVSNMKISELAAMLPERQFIYCHRAYLINLGRVSALRYGEVDMSDGETIPVSKHRYAEVKEQYTRYLRQ